MVEQIQYTPSILDLQERESIRRVATREERAQKTRIWREEEKRYNDYLLKRNYGYVSSAGGNL